MEPLNKVLERISIPVHTSPTDTPASSAASEVCPICRGAGYLRMEAPVGHPNFARILPCRCKAEELAARGRGGLERLGNLDAFTDKTFASFDYTVPGVREALTRCAQYAANPHGWLLLYGTYGCGKTHLAAAIANEALARGLQTCFAIAPDLLDHLRAAYAPNSETSYDERFEAVRTVPLLIIDDLGTENTTPWAREKLYQIFNHRYNYHMPTVVTMNTTVESLDPRIESRLQDQQWCAHLIMRDALDYRKRGQGAPFRGEAPRSPARPPAANRRPPRA